jgi:hypothetical protein
VVELYCEVTIGYNPIRAVPSPDFAARGVGSEPCPHCSPRVLTGADRLGRRLELLLHVGAFAARRSNRGGALVQVSPWAVDRGCPRC